jgi:hypothetical protein
VRFSVFTGINDNPLVVEPTDMFMVGSRARPIKDYKEEIAKRPMYILSEIPTSGSLEIPGDYEPIFNLNGITLYRWSHPVKSGALSDPKERH